VLQQDIQFLKDSWANLAEMEVNDGDFAQYVVTTSQ